MVFLPTPTRYGMGGLALDLILPIKATIEALYKGQAEATQGGKSTAREIEQFAAAKEKKKISNRKELKKKAAA